MARGDGRVYRVKGSRFWHIEYPGPVRGSKRETTGETTREGARRVLRQRRSEAEQARNGRGGFDNRTLTVEQLVRVAVADLETRGLPSARAARSREKTIVENIGPVRALAVDRATIQAYQKKRTDEGAAGVMRWTPPTA